MTIIAGCICADLNTESKQSLQENPELMLGRAHAQAYVRAEGQVAILPSSGRVWSLPLARFQVTQKT